MKRSAEWQRKTHETQISGSLSLEGKGIYSIDTPIGFLNHLLESFAKHGRFDLALKA